MIDKAYDKTPPKAQVLARDMTLRDHFAGLAMQAYFTGDFQYPNTFNNHAEWAYCIADEMMEARCSLPS